MKTVQQGREERRKEEKSREEKAKKDKTYLICSLTAASETSEKCWRAREI